MRFRVFALVMLAAAPAAADHVVRASDPAFLGIEMDDTGSGCSVHGVTPDTGAALAGLKMGDLIVGLDHHPTLGCNEVTSLITSRAAGDSITLQLLGGRQITATLTTRTDVMRRRMLGHPVSVDIDAIDSTNHFQPMVLDHRAIVGWFPPNCADCAALFAKVDRWNHTHGKLPVFGATYYRDQFTPSHTSDGGDAKLFADTYKIGIPLLRINAPMVNGVDQKLPIVFDVDRVVFTVTDEAGDVTYIAPIAPAADDLDAALEELFVAATAHGHVAAARR